MIILSNLEDLNASMIDSKVNQRERLEKLNDTAKKELNILANDKNIINLQELDKKSNNELIDKK